jgi:hypothetical protein
VFVLFNDAKEFCEELREAVALGEIDPPFIRFSARAHHADPFVSISATASYRARGEVVQLRQYCGNYMVGMEADARKRQEACKRILDDIRALAAELGLTERTGCHMNASD